MSGFVGLLLLATCLCMWFVDQPVAEFFAHHRSERFFFQLCAAPSLLSLPVAGVVMAYAVLARLRGTGSRWPGVAGQQCRNPGRDGGEGRAEMDVWPPLASHLAA